jgi:uncharacterized protein DUF3800
LSVFIVFLDEAGYTPDWRAGISQQPFYALSAVCLPADRLQEAYSGIRAAIAALSLRESPGALGRGFEIKAKEIATGAAWWKFHNAERDAVRAIMLAAPRQYGGSAFVVAIDKERHRDRYTSPADPYLLAFQFIFERLALFLGEKNDVGYCVYDHNTRLEAELLERSNVLIQEGSEIYGYSRFYGEPIHGILRIERVQELVFGTSSHSLGLQLADYVATMTYCYLRDGRPSPCGWWDTLKAGLHTRFGALDGVGLKIFPPDRTLPSPPSRR